MILDASGKPLKRAAQALAEPQTARLGHLHRLYEEHPSAGLTPGRVATILRAAEEGDLVAQHDLFRDMEEKDGHIACEMGKRRGAVLVADWDIVPPEDASAHEKADAQWLREALDNLELEEVITDALDAIGHGFSCLEIVWQTVGRERLPQGLEHRPQSWFRTHPERRNEIRLRDNTPEGAELLPFGWLVHVHKARSGYLARGGLHRTLAWPYLFKNYAVRDLAEFLEIYGLPLRLGKFPGGATTEEKTALLRAVMAIGHNAGGIIPEGMSIEFQEAAKGASDPYEAMISWAERTQSKAILGQTLTAQADGKTSTNALGKVHDEVRGDILEADCRQLARTLKRQLVWPLLAINRPGADPTRCPAFVFDISEPEDIGQFATALPKLAQAGMRIPVAWAHEKLGIPEPASESEPILGARAAADGEQDDSPGPDTAKPARGQKPDPEVEDDAALASRPKEGIEDVLARRLGTAGQPVVDGWLQRIEALLTAQPGLTPAEIQRRLLDAYGDLPTDELVEIMAQGYAIAALAGMDAARG